MCVFVRLVGSVKFQFQEFELLYRLRRGLSNRASICGWMGPGQVFCPV